MTAVIDAVSVGHDLSRGTSAFRRVARARPELVEPRRAPGRPDREAGALEMEAPVPMPEERVPS
jgi:single-strand DNA-binding protein